MAKEIFIVTARVADVGGTQDGSLIMPCGRCREPVEVSSKMKPRVTEIGEENVLCLYCACCEAVESGEVEKFAQQWNETFRNLGRPDLVLGEE